MAVAQVYKEGGLTGEKMREAAISWKDVFDEIPINVHSSPLATSLLHSIEPDTVADSRDFARLDLSVGPLLEKNLEFLNDCLDDVVAEQQKVGSGGMLIQPLPAWRLLFFTVEPPQGWRQAASCSSSVSMKEMLAYYDPGHRQKEHGI